MTDTPNYPPPPPPAYGGGGIPAAPSNGAGVTSLVTGIVGIFCCPIILSIIAIVFGNKGKKLAAEGRATNGGVAQAGFILGIIGLILGVIGVVVWIILAATGNIHFSTSTNY